jgi:hypothetical protein
LQLEIAAIIVALGEAVGVLETGCRLQGKWNVSTRKQE